MKTVGLLKIFNFYTVLKQEIRIVKNQALSGFYFIIPSGNPTYIGVYVKVWMLSEWQSHFIIIFIFK